MTRTLPTRTGALVVLATLGAAALGALPIARGALDLDSFLAASRYTARWSFAWFLVAFSASSLAVQWPTRVSRFFASERRGVGLGFAAAHLVHAGFFLTAMLAFGMPVEKATLVAGGVAYLIVLGMAFTSNERSQRALGLVAWRRWHLVGSGYLALIFAFTYAGRISTKPWVAIFGLGVMALALALRASASWARRRANLAALPKLSADDVSDPS